MQNQKNEKETSGQLEEHEGERERVAEIRDWKGPRRKTRGAGAYIE